MSRKMKMKRKMKRKFRIYREIKFWVRCRILDKLRYEKHIEFSFPILVDITNRELLYIYKNAERLIPELKENDGCDRYALVIGYNPLYKYVDYDIYL